MSIENIPTLAADIGVCGASLVDEAVGAVCFAIGVAAGILINQGVE